LLNQSGRLAYLKEALALSSRWSLDIAGTHFRLGEFHSLNHDFPEALSEYKNALNSYLEKKKAPHPSLAPVHREMGVVYMAIDSQALARDHFYRSVENYLQSKQDLPTLQGLPSLDQLQDRSGLLSCIAALAQAEHISAANALDKTEVLKIALAAYALGDSVANRQRTSFAGSTSRLQVSKDALPLYTGTIRTLLDLYGLEANPAYLDRAFSSAEKSKGLSMLQSQWEAEANGQAYLPDSLLFQRRLWLGDLHRMQEKIRENTRNREGYDTLQVAYWENRAYELEEKLEDWRRNIARDYPDYQDRLQQEVKVSPEQVQRDLLKPGEALVEYAIGLAPSFAGKKYGEDELYTFVITKDDIKTYRTPIDEGFSANVQALSRSMSDYRFVHDSVEVCYATYTRAAHALYQLLIAPILADFSDLNQLIIVPDGIINLIPFEALLTKPADPDKVDYIQLPYLLHKMQIRYGYSAAQLLEVAARPQRSGLQGCLALAPGDDDPKGAFATRGELAILRDESLGTLPGAREEVLRLSKMGLNGQFYFGSEATESRFKTEAGNYAILYLAQHGFADARDPLESHLKFTETPGDSTEDSRLHTYELAGLTLKADLAVLSACQTGVGKYLPGEGVASMGRDFIAAGVSNVVMTLWQVEDQSSTGLMERFFAQLKEGKPSASALHEAKIAFLAEADSRTAHPFYWAGYVSNGASKSIPMDEGFNWTWVLAGLGILIVLVGMALNRAQNRKAG
jgi:CHAT domain-containing protein